MRILDDKDDCNHEHHLILFSQTISSRFDWIDCKYGEEIWSNNNGLFGLRGGDVIKDDGIKWVCWVG